MGTLRSLIELSKRCTVHDQSRWGARDHDTRGLGFERSLPSHIDDVPRWCAFRKKARIFTIENQDASQVRYWSETSTSSADDDRPACSCSWPPICEIDGRDSSSTQSSNEATAVALAGNKDEQALWKCRVIKELFDHSQENVEGIHHRANPDDTWIQVSSTFDAKDAEG